MCRGNKKERVFCCHILQQQNSLVGTYSQKYPRRSLHHDQTSHTLGADIDQSHFHQHKQAFQAQIVLYAPEIVLSFFHIALCSGESFFSCNF
jgi:hypothetical protein